MQKPSDDDSGHTSSHHAAQAAWNASSPPPPSVSGRKRGRPRGSCNKAKLAVAEAAAAVGRAAVAAGIDSLLSATAADGADAASRREQLLKLVADSIVNGGKHLAAATASARQPRRCSISPAVPVHEQYTAGRTPEGQHNLSFSHLSSGEMKVPLSEMVATAALRTAASAVASTGPWQNGNAPTTTLWNGCSGTRPADLCLGSVRNPQNGSHSLPGWAPGPASSMTPFANGVYHNSSSASEQHAGPQLPPADGSFWDAQFLVAADDGPWDSREPDCEDPLWLLANGCPALAPVDVAADSRNRSSRYDDGGRCCIENGLQRRQQWSGLDGRSDNGDGGLLSSHHTGSHFSTDGGGAAGGSLLPHRVGTHLSVDIGSGSFSRPSASPFSLSLGGGGGRVPDVPTVSSGGKGLLAPLWTTADMNAAHQQLQLPPIRHELLPPARTGLGCAGVPPGNCSAYFLPVRMIQAATTTPALPLTLPPAVAAPAPEPEARPSGGWRGSADDGVRSEPPSSALWSASVGQVHEAAPSRSEDINVLEKVRREPDRVVGHLKCHNTAKPSVTYLAIHLSY